MRSQWNSGTAQCVPQLTDAHMAGKKKEPEGTFEDALHRLEEIVQRLEQGDVPLEQAMHLYEEGIGL
jgi:exonuclease VII small subunit